MKISVKSFKDPFQVRLQLKRTLSSYFGSIFWEKRSELIRLNSLKMDAPFGKDPKVFAKCSMPCHCLPKYAWFPVYTRHILGKNHFM